jgi:protein-tyrosine phosphatase
MSPSLYWIDANSPGRLAITSRPRGDDWLEDEVEAWRKNGVDVVVSLLTPDEVEELGLRRESVISEARGIRFLSFPIKDREVPASQTQTETFVDKVREALESGRNVAIHCRQSVGRSALIAAALLIVKGATAEEAIRRITIARGLAVPETAEQERWLAEFSKAISSNRTPATRNST